MARNIEIKAHAQHYEHQLNLARNIADGQERVLLQTDTFFRIPSEGDSAQRLKLREFAFIHQGQKAARDAQLIFYQRNNAKGPTLSDYHITRTPDALALKHTLTNTFGILATVEKRRTLLMVGRTRLHFDEVTELGQFIELEVVLAESDAIGGGKQEADTLMTKLEISEDDLIDVAYVDLLLAQS